MIELRNINAAYSENQVLKSVSLRINQGDITALTGANGAGKTTLLKVISGVMRCDGDVFINGSMLHLMSGYERAGIMAIVPQNIPSDIPLDGYDFVMLGRTHRLRRFAQPQREDHEAVREAMASTSTLELGDRFLHEMSGGERQRLALAMAFAAHPRIILLDEATAHLDLHHRAGIMRLLREMNREKNITVIMAVHDLTLASRYFDRLIMLKEGSVISDGTPGEVLREDILNSAYGCPVRVVHLPDDLGAAIVPLENKPTCKTIEPLFS
jgi:iron complex transport system ATP-binding protein